MCVVGTYFRQGYSARTGSGRTNHVIRDQTSSRRSANWYMILSYSDVCSFLYSRLFIAPTSLPASPNKQQQLGKSQSQVQAPLGDSVFKLPESQQWDPPTPSGSVLGLTRTNANAKPNSAAAGAGLSAT